MYARIFSRSYFQFLQIYIQKQDCWIIKKVFPLHLRLWVNLQLYFLVSRIIAVERWPCLHSFHFTSPMVTFLCPCFIIFFSMTCAWIQDFSCYFPIWLSWLILQLHQTLSTHRNKSRINTPSVCSILTLINNLLQPNMNNENFMSVLQ